MNTRKPAIGSRVPAEATKDAYGDVYTDAPIYRPFERVTVRVYGRSPADSTCTIRVCDPQLRPYLEQAIPLEHGRAELPFVAGGAPGPHYVFLHWPGEEKHSRYTNFLLDAETRIQCGDEAIENLLPWTRERMRLGRRSYAGPAGKRLGYISGDTHRFNGIWLRDSIYGMPAYQHWEPELEPFIDAFLNQQDDSGMIPDGILATGKTWRVGMESDVEYILVLAAWQVWRATGDDEWLSRRMPQLERALAYIRSDPKRWDPSHQLVKRQHSCDTWDFDIDGADDTGGSRHVVATCDQSGYWLAYRLMSRLHAHLGNGSAAERWEAIAHDHRRRAVELLWDGIKFKHHVHLDAIDHGDFDEADQLAMGNTWAMTRGLANEEQARSIVDEYRRRHERTGDAYPWWSLQPGYPDHLGYFASRPFLRQGGYANGGLMPWVGGELTLAAFQCGRERYGYELLRQYLDHTRRTGGVHVWYWPDGKAGFRTRNEVPYTGWAMAQWIAATLEGLAGVEDEGGQLRRPTIAPRWSVTKSTEATVVYRYAAAEAYVAYRWECDRSDRRITLRWTGTAEHVRIRLLLPRGWRPRGLSVNGEDQAPETVWVDQSHYLVLDAPCEHMNELRLTCEAAG